MRCTTPLKTSLLPFLIAIIGAAALATAADNDDLNMQEVNLLIVTDVHSWVAGRGRHESPTYNANYGHIVSFVERLRSKHPRKDIWFVMNGDFIDGTGLSNVPPRTLAPILKHMPWDALNIGNHELYHNETILYMKESGFVDHWNGTYLTSNVRMADTGKYLGSQYTLLRGQSATLLTFGFLYNMWNACPGAIVDKVEEVVESQWFRDALTDLDYDAIVILAHMHVEDRLVPVLLSAIRSVVGDKVAVQFVTGHTHVRSYAALDDMASSFEAGHYLDTLGFLSFDTSQGSFDHRFIDANIKSLPELLDVSVSHEDNEAWMTPNGKALSDLIIKTQTDLGLLDYVGCATRTYYVEEALHKRDSLWRLYLHEVIRRFYFQNDPTSIYLGGVGAFRTDLWEGDILVDDLISVAPFNDTIYRLNQKVPGDMLLQYLLGGVPNKVLPGAMWNEDLPRLASSLDIIDTTAMYDLYTDGFDLPGFVHKLENLTGGIWYGEPQYKDGSNNTILVTQTSLWLDFVKEMWPTCDHEDPFSSSHGGIHSLPKWEFILVVVGVALAMICAVYQLMSSAKRRRRAGYTMSAVSVTTQELDMRAAAHRLGGAERWNDDDEI